MISETMRTFRERVGARMRRARDTWDVFALGPSSLLYYTLSFYLAPVLILLGIFGPAISEHHGFNVEAIAYSLLGLLGLVAGYYSGAGRWAARKLPSFLSSDWKRGRVPWAFAFMFLAGALAKAVRLLGGGYFHIGRDPDFTGSLFFSAIGFLDWFSYVALLIVFSYYYVLRAADDDRWRVWRVVAWSALVLEMAYAIPTCGREIVIVPILLVLLARWFLWKRSWASILIAGVVVAVVVIPFGSLCRNYVSVTERLVVNKGGSEAAVGLSGYAADAVVSRIDRMLTFKRIVEAELPRLYGADYSKLFISLGPPRFIWRDKPVITPDGNEFGRAIGSITLDDRVTNVGPTIIGDFYLNFGVLGILLGMFFTGTVFRFLYEYLIGASISLSGVMIYSIAWVQLMKGLENWQYPVWAGLIKMFVLLVLVHVMLTSNATRFRSRYAAFPIAKE